MTRLADADDYSGDQLMRATVDTGYANATFLAIVTNCEAVPLPRQNIAR